MPETTKPLAGLKVLDIATIIAAPLAATLLADYGAEVVKIEMPGQGDGVRYFPPFKDGKPLWWKTANRNKKFASLDLRTSEGLALFKRLLPRFDVVTLFHSGEFRGEANDAYGALTDREVMDLFTQQTDKGGYILFYRGSYAYDVAERLIPDWMKAMPVEEVEGFKTLRIFRKTA